MSVCNCCLCIRLSYSSLNTTWISSHFAHRWRIREVWGLVKTIEGKRVRMVYFIQIRCEDTLRKFKVLMVYFKTISIHIHSTNCDKIFYLHKPIKSATSPDGINCVISNIFQESKKKLENRTECILRISWISRIISLYIFRLKYKGRMNYLTFRTRCNSRRTQN
jgi:hypothetical protein